MHKRSYAARIQRQLFVAREILGARAAKDEISKELDNPMSQAELWSELRRRFREPIPSVVSSFYTGEVLKDGQGEGTLQRLGWDLIS